MSPAEPLDIAVKPGEQQLGDGRYVVVGSLGAGSQGETLEAVDKREGRPVAIKRFTIRHAKSWKDVELAEREAQVLASLNHPALPRYIEHFEEDGALYLVMEKVEGETLWARQKRGAPLTSEQVLRFLRESGTCLAYLHGHAPPIVHRDIKPGNVILRPDGSYCIVDFGSVRDRLKPEGGSTVVGTFGFMAPEQFQGRAAPGSDVYAVGATALCLLTGREPEDLPHKGLAIDVDGALRGQVDRRLIGALTSMLEPDPDRRPASVAEALRRSGLFDAKPSDANTRPREATPRRESEPHDSKQAPRDPRDTRAILNDAINDVIHGTVAQAAKQARRARIAAEDELYRAREELAQPFLREGRRQRERAERHAAKHARKAAQREARRQERSARRYGSHRPGPPVIPGQVLGLFLLLAFRLASVGVFVLFQLLLPLLFTLLGRPSRRDRLLTLGQKGQHGLERAGQHIRYALMGGPLPELDVATDTNQAGPRLRVDTADDPDEARAAMEEVEAELAGSPPPTHKAKSG